MNPDFLSRAGSVFFAALLAAVVVNYFGSLFLCGELRMALNIDVLIALGAVVISHLCFLQKHTAQLERRIEELERKVSTRR